MSHVSIDFPPAGPREWAYFARHDWGRVPYVLLACEASWCPHCIKLQEKRVFATLAAAEARRRKGGGDASRDCDIIAVNVDGDATKDFPEAATPATKTLASDAGVQGYPTVMLLTAKGRTELPPAVERTAEGVGAWLNQMRGM